jgi:hypothetical protein
VKALDDVNIFATNANERTSFMLSVFELPLFVSSQPYFELSGDLEAKLARGVESKELH